MCAQSDKGILLEAGTGYTNVKSVFAGLNDELIQHYMIKFESIAFSNYIGGLEYRRSTGDIFLGDFRINLGYLISSKNRIQFPIGINLSIYSLTYEDNKYGSVGIGINLGLRFYLTNKLCFTGRAGLNSYGINNLNGDRFSNSLGTISARDATLSLGYFF